MNQETLLLESNAQLKLGNEALKEAKTCLDSNKLSDLYQMAYIHFDEAEYYYQVWADSFQEGSPEYIEGMALKRKSRGLRIKAKNLRDS